MDNRRRGFILVLSSPSGAGKTTVSKLLMQQDSGIVVSVSATTRPPRDGEIHGKDYFFMTPEEFKQSRSNNEFLEHAKVFGNYYGTLRASVEQKLENGRDILLDIDWQGNIQLIQNARSDVVSVFMLPPSLAALRERLLTRGLDSQEVIDERMRRAKHEISHWYGYDYVIVNNNIDETLDSVLSILHAERARRTRQQGLWDFVENMFKSE
ncbi:guanylate kinase [Rickettsiales bacterium]|nr:guanylate kinase [Rickettsiales bacterium]